MARVCNFGVAVVFIVSSYPDVVSSECSCVCGASSVFAMSYAGVGMPSLAKIDDAS